MLARESPSPATNRLAEPANAFAITSTGLEFYLTNSNEGHQMRTTRMQIGEVVSDDLLKQILADMKDHIASIPGLVGHSISGRGRWPDGDSDHRLAQSTGLRDIPRQPSLSSI